MYHSTAEDESRISHIFRLQLLCQILVTPCKQLNYLLWSVHNQPHLSAIRKKVIIDLGISADQNIFLLNIGLLLLRKGEKVFVYELISLQSFEYFTSTKNIYANKQKEFDFKLIIGYYLLTFVQHLMLLFIHFTQARLIPPGLRYLHFSYWRGVGSPSN